MGHRKRAPGLQVLLRKTRLHRNLPFGSGPDASVFFALPKRVSGGADCGRRGGWRAIRGSIARHVQAPARAKFRGARERSGSDVIVLGGGISNISSIYDGLPELIGQHAFSDGVRTTVVRAAHGDSSGVRGAALLWPIEKT
jgi:hypothetical protein